MLLAVVSLSGCAAFESARAPWAPAPTTSGIAVTSPVPGDGDLSAFLETIALARMDRGAWSELLDPRDPTFAAEAERLRTNLERLEVDLAATGRTHRPTAARRELLGDSASVRAVRVRWAVPGHASATHTLWLTLTVQDGRTRLAGLTDGPGSDGPVPLWLQEPLRVATGEGVAVLAAEGLDPGPWLVGITVARADLIGRGLPSTALVVQIPSGVEAFERTLGVRRGTHRSVAAAAWPFGDTAHIVVNPAAAATTMAEARQVLLTHEAVHVATGSVGRKGPLWLSEGYADLVALAGRPAVTAAHERHLAEDQRRHGVASGLVSDTELDSENFRVDAHYQRAWLTVRVLDRGDGTADRVHAAVRAGTPLDRALADEGWSEVALASAVQAELARLVG